MDHISSVPSSWITHDGPSIVLVEFQFCKVMEEKDKGKPLGEPDKRQQGNARPEKAGSEGGLGFLGDQRKTEEHGAGEGTTTRENPPLDGTITGKDVEGDRDPQKPGANLNDRMWDGPRLKMELRKREPVIIW